MIKAIMFDVGEVLLKNKFELVTEKIANDLNIDVDSLQEFKTKHHPALITGRLSVEDFIKLLKDEFNLRFTEKDIKAIWENAYIKVRSLNGELLKIVEKLKRNYRIGIISNIYDLCGKIDFERDFFIPFEPCILSYEVGLAKPQKEIFELALKRLGLKAEECVFLDNRDYHLEEPKKLGFKTIHFKNNKQLIEDFKKLGIEI